MIRLALSSVKGKQLQIRLLLFMMSLLCIAAVQAQPTGATISNPIVIGTYTGGTYNYTDTKNNSTSNNFQHNMGQASDDIYYKLIVQGSTQLSISLCSSTFDTYLHLLDNTGTVLFSNDDNGPLCSGLSSSIQTTVAAGTYFIVTEGYSSNSGNLVLSVNAVVQAPVVYDTRNFIKVWEAAAPETNPNTLMTKDVQDVKHSVQYFDGLGRPEQTVVKKGSLSEGVFGDVVKPTVYDGFGREVQQYLPYVAGTNDGLYKTNALTDQNGFYSGAGSPIANQGETVYYGYTKFESSPLNRVEESFAPGNSWAGTKDNLNATDRRSVKIKYWINTITDAVRIWNVTDVTNGFGTYATTAAYPAGELYKNVTEDEHGKQVIEFKDKEGKVILKKVQLTASAETTGSGSGHAGWICTYYIYDDLNNLRAVLQPEGVKLLDGSNWANCNPINTSIYPEILPEQTFRYEYDHRNRMIMKKVPGAGEVYTVYDARDRLVMVQDANMRSNDKWMATLYDGLNRPVETGLVVNSWFGSNKTFAQHRTDAGSSIEYPFSSGTGYPVGSNWEQLTQTAYDTYSTLPSVGLSSTYLTTWNGNFAATSQSWPYPQMPVQSNSVKGMVTWTRVKVLNSSSDYIYTVMIYDDKGRVIQAQSKNDVTGGVDVVTTQYSWSGQPLVAVQKQQITGTNAQTHTLVTKMEYDELGRVKEVKKKINADTEKIIAKNEYDKLGQLKNKKLATYYSGGAIETLSYDYNIRGWMLGVNRSYLNTDNSTKFGFELSYDKKKSAFDNNSADTYAGYQFNGNIAGMMWRSMGDGQKRKYDFEYDAINRLSKADFKQYNSGWNVDAGIDFSVGGSATNNNRIAYDDNGNIKEMWQKGLKLNSSDWIDKMSYTYFAGTNKLQAVTEAITTENKLGDFYDKHNGTTDYGYDKNGNMVTDKNKDLGATTGLDLTNGGAITYNHLNLPQTITVTGKGTITYTYDASGNKIKKVTDETASGSNNNTNTITTTLYIGGSVYETKVVNSTATYTNKLQFTGQEEGRIRALYPDAASTTITGYAYDYMLKDHLGNVRMVLTDEVTTNYYPAATLEGTYDGSTNSMVNHERKYYNIDNSKITSETSIASWGTETTGNTKLYYNHNDIPPASPNPNYPASVSPTPATGSTKLYKLNASTNKTGLEFVMKVMAGDKVDILGKSYYLNTTTVSNSNSTTMDLLGMFTSLLLAPVNGIGAKGITASQLEGWNSGLVPSSFFRGNNNETGAAVPKAYINYIFLDEQFKFVSGSASRVGSSGTVKNHWNDDAALQNINVPKNGYLFVYVSNESNFDVFFDNLQVVHKPGPVIEETHYYPFGLTMAGISSKAANITPNKEKTFQGQRFDDEFGLNWAQFKWRNHDVQIGRFIEVDPLSEKYVYNSTYAFSENKVTGHVELEGLEAAPTEDKRPYPGRVPATNTIGNLARGFSFGLNGQYQTEPVRGSTVTGIRDTKGGGKNAAGKIKGIDVIRVDQSHGTGRSAIGPHLNINEKVTNVPDPHTPLTSTQFNGLKTAGQVLDGINKVAKPIAIVTDVIQLGNAITTDIQQGTGGDNTIITSSRVAGGWAGAWGGAKGGALIGAAIGSVVPGVGTAIGGFVGGIIGGIGGAFVGSKAGEWAGEKIVETKNDN